MENGHAKYRVAVIGSGNWGSVASRLIASNTAKLPSFYDEVRMWVFEEMLPTGKKLSESINEENENCKYLPGIKLGANVIADPDLESAVGGRNRRVAEAFARNGGKRSFDELEAEMLRGQKLQGVSTAREVYEVLTYRGWQELFPLLSTVHEICIGQLPPTSIVEYSEHTPNLSLIGGPTPFY
nr:unnamed protein product [Digitaria exilis]